MSIQHIKARIANIGGATSIRAIESTLQGTSSNDALLLIHALTHTDITPVRQGFPLTLSFTLS